ncbi:MAG: thymidine phosphorylase [bacterium]|nr:thymidine phosphorylase [bacterium]
MGARSRPTTRPPCSWSGARPTSSPATVLPTRGGSSSRSSDAWRAFVQAVTRGGLPDYQTAALLMAVYLRGMDFRETYALTEAIADSGERLTWPDVGRPLVDKHSTGGVGDNVTLVAVPLLAACGAAVPKLSGRALGHTGGTLDKLEAVPGFRTDLALDEFRRILAETGCFIAGHSEKIAPADTRLYHLRDVTATVDSIPLVTASIVGKKLAAGADTFIIDVKTGRGALFPSQPRALRLARWIKRAAETAGRRCVCILSDMGSPLGRKVGNALEVEEALAVLAGEAIPEVRELSLELVARGLKAAGLAENVALARDMARRKLDDGSAREVFARMVQAQGGDLAAFARRERGGAHTGELKAPRSGWLRRVDARNVGRAARLAGAGRSTVEDRVDPEAGVELFAKPGDRVTEGDPLLVVHASTEDGLRAALGQLSGGVVVGDEPPGRRPLIRRVLD